MTSTTTTTTGGFTDEERDAMKERAQEVRGKKGDGLVDLLGKVAEMEDADRVMAERLHILVGEAAPELDAEDLVRHAGLRQGRQGRALLQAGREVQGPVRDARLQRLGGARRRRDVADGVRAGPADAADEKQIAALISRAVR